MYSKFITSGFAFIFLLFSLRVESQKYKFNHLDIPLNSNRVECITQDSEGFVWIGTLAGLHKFDGVNLTEYLYSEDSFSLNGSRVYHVLEDANKRLWIGTENGIYQYSRDFDHFIRFDTEQVSEASGSQVNDYIYELFEDPSEQIWVSGTRSGLQFFDEQSDSFSLLYLSLLTLDLEREKHSHQLSRVYLKQLGELG